MDNDRTTHTRHRRADDPTRQGMSAVKIIDWRALAKNNLLGFCKAEFPSGLIVTDITIMTSERGPWASPPGKPMIGRDGVVLKDDKGKIRYTPVIEFSSKEVRQRWSDAVIEAMHAAHPEAFIPRAAILDVAP